MFSAVLDTSVLWPSSQRDFLLSLAAERTYSPRWSTAILNKVIVNEAEKLTKRGIPAEEAERSAERLIGQMSPAFDDALVTDWEPLEEAEWSSGAWRPRMATESIEPESTASIKELLL